MKNDKRKYPKPEGRLWENPKPCPFCRGPGTLQKRKPDGYHTEYRMECENFMCTRMKGAHGRLPWEGTRSEAISMWNQTAGILRKEET